MAKRKAARAPRRRSGQAKKTGGARKAAARGRTAKKVVRRKRTARKVQPAAKSTRKTRKPAARTGAARRTVARKRAPAKTARPARSTPARTRTAGATRKVVAKASANPNSKRTAIPVVRKPPSLDRERRVVRDEDDLVQGTPPSSLDLDRSASAVRTGRRVLKDRYDEHTETSPALTAGDVDADWESAYSVGDEAPGGDNPTPDQDIVDDIGRAVGVEYQDNEELKGEEKIAKRDRNRWELDPASSDDWDDR
jgi:hypothetical protein